MNINLQICGLIVVLFLLILFRSNRRLDFAGDRVFMRMLIMVAVCISFDALSVVAIFYRESISAVIVRIACKAYLISMVWVGWTNLCYVMLEMIDNSKRYGKLVRIAGAAAAAATAVIAFVPIHIYNQNDSVYTYGPAVVATYIATLMFIVAVLLNAIYISRKRNSRRGRAVILTTALWILAAAIQAIDNATLVVGFSMAVGTMILYVVLENPDANLDKQLGCFNSYAFYKYMAIKMGQGDRFSILEFSITDLQSLENRSIDIAAMTRSVIEDFKNKRNLHIFKNMSASVVAVSESKELLEQLNSAIMKIVSENREISNSVVVISVEDANRLETVDELLKFLTHIRTENAGRLSASVYVSDEMLIKYKCSKEMEKEINQALEEDRVEVFLQPICRRNEKTVPAAEALVRIRGRDGSLISSGAFIPVAEATGQVGALGERVLEKVCEFLRDSEAVELGLEKVDVNLSVVQCDDASTAGRLSEIVNKYGIDKNLVNFEITETAVSTAKDILLENMNMLVSTGFTFALDDFGKGESNLIYIVEMPVNMIKLDMDMSKAFFNVPKAKHIVGAIIEMAHKLGMKVVAEGIETREELEGIAAAGVDLIQGYYYSKPLPMKEFLDYMKNRTAEELEDEGNVQDVIAESEPGETGEAQKDLTGRRILVVEDNEMNSEIARDILEELGFETDAAEDGLAAVEKVFGAEPGFYDLILMDIRMPVMDGYEATRRIRAAEDENVSSIPIIAFTASNKEEDRNKALASGMNRYTLKPINPDEIYEIIEELI